ncbi:MAG: alpha/beta hydrolase [Planctomycetes bacterium]|nr:alpha/beta hydrolase [Planctomycetota bacterium]
MKKILNEPYSEKYQERRRIDWFFPDVPNGRALLGIHGGGWSGGSKEQWHTVAEHFCEKGYTCASAEYRLGPENSFEDMIEDVRLAMAVFRRHSNEYDFRVDRIATLGSSAGGHLVAMLATIGDDDTLGISNEIENRHTRPDFAICYCPVLSLYDRGPVKGYFNETARAMLGCEYDDDADLFRTYTPLDRITGEEPPFLLVHGDADETIPLRHSTEMHRALLETGGSSRLVVLPGVGHGFGYGVASEAQKLGLRHISLALDDCWGQ